MSEISQECQTFDHTNPHLELMAMVSNIVAAYVSNHTVEVSNLPRFIKSVQQSLSNRTSQDFPLLGPENPVVPIEDSITPDYIICLEDGKKMKMLKRHLKTAYNMTPDQYRERWNLPAN